jgi:predicted transglutaminase-like cysteine proteinase
VTSAPAHASAGLFLELPLASAAALIEPGLVEPGLVAPAHGTACGEAPRSRSKSSAILGGAPSKLELISMQQSADDEQANASLALSKVEPAAGGFRCMQTALPWAGSVARPFQPSRNPGDFLGSARLPLTRTNFDGQWDRVRNSALSARAVSSLAPHMHGNPDIGTLSTINAAANRRIRYKEDRDLYGQADYWATASATLNRGAGDCEDIAIVKMQALAALGVSRSDMFLTIARDTIRNADHALLVVRLNGRYWLLDNATDTVLDAGMSYDYRPIMSFSASGKWLHGYTRAEQAQTAVPAAPLLASR